MNRLLEFDCSRCGNTYSVFTGGDTARCPKCGTNNKKKITAPSVHYKGQGFYSTDNK